MTTDNFTEAARAETPEPCEHHWVSHGQDSALIPWVIRCDLCGAFNTPEMERAARTHLAAQEPEPLPDASELGIYGDWLVVLNAQEADYPAGAEWGHIPGSQHIPLFDLSRVAGYPPEPTDAEVEAGEESIDCLFGWEHLRRYSGQSEEWMDQLRKSITHNVLSAARAARRDEEKRDG